MKNIVVITLFLTLGLVSCKNSEQKIDKLQIAKKYYKILDNSNATEITTLLSDSIVIREKEDDYEERFSNKGYVDWLKWDGVFNPTYKILEIEEENETVKAKISKIDIRISFLHEVPMVWTEVIKFDNDKIIQVERTGYEVFNVSTFLKNRDSLTNWINKNHPELNGFLYDQTENGGMNYLKAIELYNNRS
jgi:hypothetical protein